MPAIFMALFRAVPISMWVIALVLGWGAYQKHSATVAQKALNEHTVAELKATIAENERLIKEQNEYLAKNKVEISRARMDATTASLSLNRLRNTLKELNKRTPRAPASAAGSTTETLTRILGECATEYRQLAEITDGAIIAGNTCQRAYGSLKPD